MKNYLRLGLILMIICVVASGGLALTYAVTKEKIALEIDKKKNEASAVALPEAKSFNDEKLTAKLKKQFPDVAEVRQGLVNGSPRGLAVFIRPRGYGGLMDLVVGINQRGQVTGIGIVTMKETPGLGDRIQQPAFLRQYVGKAEGDPVKIGKDIDAISGATISSRAVTKGVKEAIGVAQNYLKDVN